MKEVKIGLLGFGTVGAGVVEGLQKNAELICARTSIMPRIVAIADLDLESDRGVEVEKSILTADASGVIENEDVDVIVELVGGVGVAREFVLRALKKGKSVVTANKALLAKYGNELFKVARENGTGIYFEASTAGGIPVLRALKDGLVGNRIESMYGILNGTCNYILTKMEREEVAFETALKEAQDAGCAEADPSLDIDGWDTAHKAVLLAALAYGGTVPLSAVDVRGIRNLEMREIKYASELGYRIKMLAVIKKQSDSYEIKVEPALISKDILLASVDDVFNAVSLEGDLVGETLHYGKGAGRLPTASAVIGDIMEAAADMQIGKVPSLSSWVASHGTLPTVDPADCRLRCYLRMSLKDEPGVFAKVANILGKNNISIASVVQKEHCQGEYTSAVMLTHEASESDYKKAFKQIDKLDIVGDKTVRLPIEEF